ncbi:unnamed protein product [Mycena citricolor]|uniref:Uncharacterized protein n=1 Tax=Mycena citricolor TaxID=2018698 RepID=A0AAD2H6B3_9AGAR|nr:unnamed protein product [Mycena citricolor]
MPSRASTRRSSTRIASPPSSGSPSRTRKEFTSEEDSQFAAFLCKFKKEERVGLHVHREAAATSWGSRHVAVSWQQRYLRRRSEYDVNCEVALAGPERRKLEPSIHDGTQHASASTTTEPIFITPTAPCITIPYPRLSKQDLQISVNMFLTVLSRQFGLDPQVLFDLWVEHGSLDRVHALLEELAEKADVPENEADLADEAGGEDEAPRMQNVLTQLVSGVVEEREVSHVSSCVTPNPDRASGTPAAAAELEDGEHYENDVLQSPFTLRACDKARAIPHSISRSLSPCAKRPVSPSDTVFKALPRAPSPLGPFTSGWFDVDDVSLVGSDIEGEETL